MILQKSNLIWGATKAIFFVLFTVVFKAIYKVLSLFCLQGVFLLGLLGLLFHLLGVFANNPILLLVYYVVLGVTAIISLSIFIRKIFRLGNRK